MSACGGNKKTVSVEDYGVPSQLVIPGDTEGFLLFGYAESQKIYKSETLYAKTLSGMVEVAAKDSSGGTIARPISFFAIGVQDKNIMVLHGRAGLHNGVVPNQTFILFKASGKLVPLVFGGTQYVSNREIISKTSEDFTEIISIAAVVDDGREAVYKIKVEGEVISGGNITVPSTAMYNFIAGKDGGLFFAGGPSGTGYYIKPDGKTFTSYNRGAWVNAEGNISGYAFDIDTSERYIKDFTSDAKQFPSDPFTLFFPGYKNAVIHGFKIGTNCWSDTVSCYNQAANISAMSFDAFAANAATYDPSLRATSFGADAGVGIKTGASDPKEVDIGDATALKDFDVTCEYLRENVGASSSYYTNTPLAYDDTSTVFNCNRWFKIYNRTTGAVDVASNIFSSYPIAGIGLAIFGVEYEVFKKLDLKTKAVTTVSPIGVSTVSNVYPYSSDRAWFKGIKGEDYVVGTIKADGSADVWTTIDINSSIKMYVNTK